MFISSLLGTITNIIDICLIDNETSRNMVGYQSQLIDLSKKYSSLHLELGDNGKYVVKGMASTSFQLDSRDALHMSDMLFILGLKKNLLSISTLEDKGYKASFVDGQVLVWPKDSNMDSARVIGV